LQYIKRTFSGDPIFHTDETLTKLANILLAYSRRNKSICYCQGFNFIVDHLLKTFEDLLRKIKIFRKKLFVQIIE
jgi:hypothetical protein